MTDQQPPHTILPTEPSPPFQASTADQVAALQARVAELEAAMDAQRRVLDNLPVLVFAQDAQRRLALWNREAERVTGFVAADYLGKTTIYDELLPDDQYRSLLGQTWERIGQHFRNWEVEVTTKAGDRRTIAWSNVPGGELGPDWTALAVGIDVTERKAVEEERLRLLSRVREQSRQVEEVIQAVPVGVAMLDGDFRMRLANAAAAEHLARLGRQDLSAPILQVGELRISDLLAAQNVRHEAQAGDYTYAVMLCPAANAWSGQHWVLVIDDVTEDRQVQARAQMQDRLAAIGQLAAGIAHDFNNLLAVVVLHAQMGLLQPDLSPWLRECLTTILSQADRAGDLVQQVLDFSRRAVLERHPLDLGPFLDEQVRLLARTLPENITVHLDAAAGDYSVSADLTRLQQVIVNLAVNARDAMHEGGDLYFRLERTAVDGTQRGPLPELKPGEWIRLSIRDTGSGIPPHVLPHIFEPFFTTKAPLGTGLGLAQVHGIVKQHEGEIDVVSSEGVGTEFIVYLPAVAPAPKVEAAPVEEELQLGHGQTVLVVEDDRAVRFALVASLEQLEYQALEARNGREALALLADRKVKVDLVLSDLIMPEMGGQALLQALREQGIRTPVVLLSGHPMDLEPSFSRRDELAGWLQKPVDLDELARLLARVLGAA